MKVKQLIKELKKMPQNLNVGYSHHDNSEHEIAGWVYTVDLLDKNDHEPPDYISKSDMECYDILPNKTVILRG